MLVFVDESGCSGFKLGQGSTPLFGVVAVLFQDRAEASRCAESMARLRHSLSLKSHKEFHFSKDSDHIRTTFLRHLAQFDFVYSAFVLNKVQLMGPGFRYKGSFYKYPIRLLFENLRSRLENAIVIYDKCGDQGFTDELGSYLKRMMRNPDGSQTVIKKFRAEDSRKNDLVQAADMVCGAVVRSFKDPSGKGQRFRNCVRNRELEVRYWPK